MSFPIKRLRRLRQSIPFRNLVRETELSVNDLIAPLFVVPGKEIKKEIPSMPGQYHFSVDTLLKECQEIFDLGIPAIILFGIPENKDCEGTEAYAPDGIVQVAIREIKIAVPDLLVITDVCMCEYTSHGHCGILDGQVVDNDKTLEKLGEIAVSHASAGADMIAPSDMMDGRIMAIRSALDTASFQHIPVMSYAAKYASAYYGPFRDAALSAPQFGDRRSYQMDPANSREALEEVALDETEGADILMVKPALAYLDIIHAVRQNTNLPVAAYNVSGEYSMIKNAAVQGLVDGEAIMMETLLSIKRAGADLILTYFAKEAADVIRINV